MIAPIGPTVGIADMVDIVDVMFVVGRVEVATASSRDSLHLLRPIDFALARLRTVERSKRAKLRVW